MRNAKSTQFLLDEGMAIVISIHTTPRSATSATQLLTRLLTAECSSLGIRIPSTHPLQITNVHAHRRLTPSFYPPSLPTSFPAWRSLPPPLFPASMHPCLPLSISLSVPVFIYGYLCLCLPASHLPSLFSGRFNSTWAQECKVELCVYRRDGRSRNFVDVSDAESLSYPGDQSVNIDAY